MFKAGERVQLPDGNVVYYQHPKQEDRTKAVVLMLVEVDAKSLKRVKDPAYD